MSQWLWVISQQLRAAATTRFRFERNDAVALFGGNQRSLVFLVTRLAASALLRPFFSSRLWLTVRVLSARRQGGVLRRLPLTLPPQVFNFRLQLRDAREQNTNYRLRFRWLTSYDLFRDDWFHARCCGMKPPIVSRSVFWCQKATTP
jgi:hypothetical protein